jgi:hypothetical protein
MRLIQAGAVAVTTLGLTLGAGACSSSDNTSTTPGQGASASQSHAPEDVRAPDAAVATGLKQIQDITGQVAQSVATDKSKAKELDEQVEPVWATIEGTVKANDSSAYITFEDSFAALEKAVESGDAAKAQQAATTVASAATAYLQKYPG